MLAHPLKTYLDDSGESISDLAARAEVSRSDISRVLNGARPRFSVPAAEKLSKATGLTAAQLLGLTDSSGTAKKKPAARRKHPATS